MARTVLQHTIGQAKLSTVWSRWCTHKLQLAFQRSNASIYVTRVEALWVIYSGSETIFSIVQWGGQRIFDTSANSSFLASSTTVLTFSSALFCLVWFQTLLVPANHRFYSCPSVRDENFSMYCSGADWSTTSTALTDRDGTKTERPWERSSCYGCTMCRITWPAQDCLQHAPGGTLYGLSFSWSTFSSLFMLFLYVMCKSLMYGKTAGVSRLSFDRCNIHGTCMETCGNEHP